MAEEAQKTAANLAEMTLLEVLPAFEQHMREDGFANNTVKAFASDVRLIAGYLPDTPVGAISTEDLNRVVNQLKEHKFKKSADDENWSTYKEKSMARRITTIKVLFGWLRKTDAVFMNPAEPVVQTSARGKLPTIPTAEEITKARAIARAWSEGEAPAGKHQARDSRPLALLSLLLDTGAKKSEIKALQLEHILRDDPLNPQIHIRYLNPRLKYKERKLAIDPETLAILDRYIDDYALTDELFTCTPRNLEYILRDIALELGYEKKKPQPFTFENLRWVSALQDLMAGMDELLIQEKQGLSKVTWRETRNKLDQLREKYEKTKL